MASKKTPTDNNAPKKTRQRKSNYYLVTLTQEDQPILVLATNARKALEAIASVKAATPKDLFEAGAEGIKTIDATTPVRAVPSAETEEVAAAA